MATYQILENNQSVRLTKIKQAEKVSASSHWLGIALLSLSILLAPAIGQVAGIASLYIW